MPAKDRCFMLTSKGVVTDIQGQKITVLPLASESCMHCTQSDCNKRGVPFTATNQNSLPLKVGMIVLISANDKNSILQGLVAVFVPILFAVLGYLLFAKLSQKEGLRAFGVLVFFFGACGIITLCSHIFEHTPEYKITSVA